MFFHPELTKEEHMLPISLIGHLLYKMQFLNHKKIRVL
jgi:hypothetical protein